MRDLNAEKVASAGLTDSNLLVYLEIERALKDRNPDLALKKLDEAFSKTADKKFKEILLRQRFLCSVRLSKFSEAKEAVKQMLDIESRNFYMALSECSLMDNRADRLTYLERLKECNPYSSSVLNAYADEMNQALEKNEKVKNALRQEQVIATLKHSLEVEASLENDAWVHLFDIYSKQNNRALLEDIVDKHLSQNPWDSRTTAMVLRYCKKFEKSEYKGKPLFEYIHRAYTHHFPRNWSAHIEIYVDACIEFDGHKYLRPLLEEAREIEGLQEDPRFALIMIEVYYDVFRDLSGAIQCAREFLKTNRKQSVEVKLIELLLANKAPQKAREIHEKLKGAVDYGRWLQLQAKIFEAEGRYQDAIDAMESIPDKRDFQERHTAMLSYLELKMGAPQRAVKRCKQFLAERSFSISFEAEIINYECGKSMSEGRIDKKRIDSVAKSTSSETVKGVCYALLEEDSKALTVFRKESEKRFSIIDECLQWPAVSRLSKKLYSIRDELLKAKRSLTDFPKDIVFLQEPNEL